MTRPRTAYLVRDHPDQPQSAGVVVESTERAARLARAGLWVTATTTGTGGPA